MATPLAKPEIALQRRVAKAVAVSVARGLLRRTRTASSPSLAATLVREWEYGTLYLFTPVAFGSGAALYFASPTEPDLSAILAGLGVLMLFAWFARGRFALQIAILAAATLVAGTLAAKLETLRKGTETTGAAVTTQVTGTLVTLQRQSSGRIRMVIDVAATARPHLKYQPARIRVTAGSVPEGIVPGVWVQGRVRLLPPSGPVRPGGYDFAFESYFDGVGATGFFLGRPKVVAPPDQTTWISGARAVLERARTGLTTRIKGRIDGEEGNVAAALITGDKGAISDEVEEALRATGLAHILSISGLHMALVAGSVAGFLRAIFALFPNFASRHASRKYAASAALLAVFAYLFISGAGIATQRSFIMLAVMLVAMLFDRAALTLRNLATAALIVLAIEPHEIAGPGFQMSFAATAALVSAYAAWSRIRGRMLAGREQRQPGVTRMLARYAGALFFTSLIAGAATTIYGIYHFQRVASLGVIANLGAMPVVSLVVMPAAVAAHVLMPFDLDGPFFKLMGWGIGVVLAIARHVAERSPIDLVPAMTLPAMLTLSAGLIVATLFSGRLRLATLPLFAAGAFSAFAQQQPAILVSEDARLVGVDLGDGRIAVNRRRPNSFVVENWLRASASRTIMKPVEIAAPPEWSSRAAAPEERPGPDRHAKRPAEDQRLLTAIAPTSARTILDAIDTAGQKPAGFHCIDDLCIARALSGALVVHARDAAQASLLCDKVSVIVIADATAGKICGDRQTVTIITARDLAQKGSAAVRLVRQAGPFGQAILPASVRTGSTGPPGKVAFASDMLGTNTLEVPRAIVSHAIAKPYRPWHAHRAFSREARGLPPWKPRTAARDTSRAQTSTPDRKQ